MEQTIFEGVQFIGEGFLKDLFKKKKKPNQKQNKDNVIEMTKEEIADIEKQINEVYNKLHSKLKNFDFKRIGIKGVLKEKKYDKAKLNSNEGTNLEISIIGEWDNDDGTDFEDGIFDLSDIILDTAKSLGYEIDTYPDYTSDEIKNSNKYPDIHIYYIIADGEIGLCVSVYYKCNVKLEK